MSGFHNGHAFNDDNDNISNAFRDEDVTVGDLMKGAGYSTGVFGKWGFGGTSDTNNPTLGSDANDLPNNQGFDEFYGYLDHVRAHNYYVPSLWETDTNAPGGLSLSSTNGVYTHDLIADRSQQFIETQSQTAQPFYAQVNYTIPHSAYDPPQDAFWDLYPQLSGNDRDLAAMITRMDASVGEILDYLNETDDPNHPGQKLAENTLVIFTCDKQPFHQLPDGVPSFERVPG